MLTTQKLTDLNYMLKVSSSETGQATRYNNYGNANMLNALARIFYKVGSAGVYISTIQYSEKDILLSFPGTPPKMALKPRQIKIIDTKLSKLLKNTETEPKVIEALKFNLFVAMYSAGNDFVLQVFIKLAEKNTELEVFKDWLKFQKFPFKIQMDHFKSESFQKVFYNTFKKILSDEEIVLLKSSYKNEIKLECFLHDRQIHEGMHVEAKGIAYLHETKKVTIFHIGLAKKFGNRTQLGEVIDKEVGCCGACTVEFEIEKEKLNFKILRTADYPNNFPPGDYKPSMLIMKNNELSTKFFNKLIDVCSRNNETLKNNPKYSKYFVIDQKNQMVKDKEERSGQGKEEDNDMSLDMIPSFNNKDECKYAEEKSQEALFQKALELSLYNSRSDSDQVMEYLGENNMDSGVSPH